LKGEPQAKVNTRKTSKKKRDHLPSEVEYPKTVSKPSSMIMYLEASYDDRNIAEIQD
jgi:hypothetical protein